MMARKSHCQGEFTQVNNLLYTFLLTYSSLFNLNSYLLSIASNNCSISFSLYFSVLYSFDCCLQSFMGHQLSLINLIKFCLFYIPSYLIALTPLIYYLIYLHLLYSAIFVHNYPKSEHSNRTITISKISPETDLESKKTIVTNYSKYSQEIR